MPAAAPDQLAKLLEQIVSRAQPAPGELQQLSDALAGAVDHVTELPDAALQQLKQAVDPPDWFSLLVFLLLRLAELDSHLSVGVLDPGVGWARAVTLTYTNLGCDLTLGLALTGEGTHGVIVQVRSVENETLAKGKTTLTLGGAGSGEWRIAFSGGGTPAAPAGASLNATLTYDPGIGKVGTDELSVTVGELQAAATLSSSAPIWRVELQLVTGDGAGGIHGSVDLAKALGPLSTFVSIAPLEETYSPRLVLADRAPPLLTLGAG